MDKYILLHNSQHTFLVLIHPVLANIELHSNQIWKDLRELYKMVKTFEKLIKINN